MAYEIQVSSEVGTLKRLLIHSPDGGIGKIVPAKFKEWLYDDTVQLSRMRREYNDYLKLLLYFLDPEKIPAILDCEQKGTQSDKQFDCYIPEKPEYFNSDKVLDTERLLVAVLADEDVRKRMIVAVCAAEGCSFATQQRLEQITDLNQLAKVLITGVLNIKEDKPADVEFIFPPLPNFIFTRDIAIVIKDHMLLSKAATSARSRESLLMKFIAYYYLYKGREDHVIEIDDSSDFFLKPEEDQLKDRVALEGGDIMMIAPHHLVVGYSERTTVSAVNELIHTIFRNSSLGIEKISVVQIPKDRAQMHIDTVFTHVRKDVWVLYGKFSERLHRQKNTSQLSYYPQFTGSEADHFYEPVKVFRFCKPAAEVYDASKNYHSETNINGLEALLRNISIEDFGIAAEDVKVIYSGNNIFPYDEREQWTDSCNLLALKDGVVVGYDRNEETIKGFVQAGFKAVKVADLFAQFQAGLSSPDEVTNTLILLPSGELSRARGGAHCMSMPLLRGGF